MTTHDMPWYIYAAAYRGYFRREVFTASDVQMENIRAAVDAAAPLLIAQGRREAAEAIRAHRAEHYAERLSPAYRVRADGLLIAARVAEGDTP